MEIIGLLALFGYVASWWLALRIVFGQRLGYLEWWAVASAALILPMMLVDGISGPGSSRGWLVAAWCGTGPVIDLAWVAWRLFRWFSTRSMTRELRRLQCHIRQARDSG